MPTIKDDISEFMGIPYDDVVKPIGNDAENYLNKSFKDMYPWGAKKDDMWNFYKSDAYSAYLFLMLEKNIEDNIQPVPQDLADIAERYITDPRILIYGAGTGIVAIGLRSMHLLNEDWNFRNITIADLPSKYFDFLKFFSKKYNLGIHFIELDNKKEAIDKMYDLIVYNHAPFESDHMATIERLVNHLEDAQYIYLNAFTLPKSCQRTPELIKLENMGLEVPALTQDKALRLWSKKIKSPYDNINVAPSKSRNSRIFPSSIACLSSLPDTACGIATYTKWLSDALEKHYPVQIFRDINQKLPREALILASIEFGIFEDTNMLINDAYSDNWKFAIWHTVFRDPVKGYLKYVQAIDAEYDAHIVHTFVQKAWLSKFVEKPIYVVPHGTLVWNPTAKDVAKEKLGFSPKDKIAFVFGFAAENKGLNELIEVSKRVKIPDFKMVMSAGSNNASKLASEYTTHLQTILKANSKDSKVIVLGKYLTEDEINLYASAADVLIFNYKTPPVVASASGAMKRVLYSCKPIICVNDNRLEELVEGQHCLKYRAGDIDGFARTIETLLNDSEMAAKLGWNCRRLAEKTSWEESANRLMQIFGDTIKGFGQEYYNEAYFSGKHGGKTYVTPGGKTEEWSYYNPDGEWLGAKPIMQAVKTILNPKNMLSVGEGRGTFCAYAQDAGIDAVGIDFSQWAIEHLYPRAKGLVELGDVRNLQFGDNSKDLVFCSDIMEHIYIDELPKAISEIQRVSRKWIFYQIGVSGISDCPDDLIVEKNQLPPKNRLVTTVAGHVTVKSEKWWREKLACKGWVFRDDLVNEFRRIVPPEAIQNWRCVIIYEKVG